VTDSSGELGRRGVGRRLAIAMVCSANWPLPEDNGAGASSAAAHASAAAETSGIEQLKGCI